MKTNNSIEKIVEELRYKYKLKDNTIYCANDIEFVTDLKQALSQAREEGYEQGRFDERL